MGVVQQLQTGTGVFILAQRELDPPGGLNTEPSISNHLPHRGLFLVGPRVQQGRYVTLLSQTRLWRKAGVGRAERVIGIDRERVSWKGLFRSPSPHMGLFTLSSRDLHGSRRLLRGLSVWRPVQPQTKLGRLRILVVPHSLKSRS